MLVPLSACARRLSEILKRLNAGKSLSSGDQAFCQRLIEANAPGRPRQGADAYKLPVYSSMQECAGATPIPLSLLKQAKRSGCAAFKWNRVDLAEFLKWLFSEQGQNAGGEASGKDWSNELKMWLAKRAKIAHDRDARLTLSIDQARHDINAGSAFYFAHWDRMTDELPAVLKGLDAVAIRERFRSEGEKFKADLRVHFTKTINE